MHNYVFVLCTTAPQHPINILAMPLAIKYPYMTIWLQLMHTIMAKKHTPQ